jgi:hypothetical protein
MIILRLVKTIEINIESKKQNNPDRFNPKATDLTSI